MSTTPKEIIEERIYIGNVDYKATTEELKDLFQGLNVIEVDIPTKNVYSGKEQSTKPLGFAFVQFGTKQEADQVIESFNGKEFKGRKIYVKKAIPSLNEEEKAKKLEDFKAKKAAEKAERKSKKLAASKSSKKLEKKTDPKAKPDSKSTPATAASTEVTSTEGLSSSKSKKRISKPKVPLDQGKKSNDSIFITNLAFEVKLKTLQNLFKEYNPVWIHVPIRKLPIKLVQKQKLEGKSPRNKGIAFVKFADESLQKKAIEEFNGTELNGRKIVVDVAIDARAPLEGEVEEDSKDSDEVEVASEE